MSLDRAESVQTKDTIWLRDYWVILKTFSNKVAKFQPGNKNQAGIATVQSDLNSVIIPLMTALE